MERKANNSIEDLFAQANSLAALGKLRQKTSPVDGSAALRGRAYYDSKANPTFQLVIMTVLVVTVS